MGGNLLETLEQLWKTWDIRVLVLTSLLLQALLTFFAPYRKRFGNACFQISIWLLYLLADAVALYVIGLISTRGRRSSGQKRDHEHAPPPELLAFWAPFLLLHLGGPDTITALALADNELWRRHALQFAAKLVITLYVFSWSFGTKLFLPTVLMLVVGCTKYLERTSALYVGSTESFRYSQRTKPEPGPDYAVLMDEYSSARGALIPAEIKGKDASSASEEATIGSQRLYHKVDRSTTHGGSSEGAPVGANATSPHWYRLEETNEMVMDGHHFGLKFRGLLADAFVSLKDREQSRAFFLRCSPSYAFRMVEIELNFIYDVFYTKAFLLNTKRGYARLVCFLLVMTSLVCFWFQEDRYDSIDVQITYALLGGAIVLDIVAGVMFLLSDWFIIIPSLDSNRLLLKCTVTWLYKCLFRWLRSSRQGCRWSESISEYNLLKCCLQDPPALLDNIFLLRWIKDAFVGGFSVRRSPIDRRIGDFIFEKLQKKAAFATDAEKIKEVCSARGNLVFHDEYLLVSQYLHPWTVDIDYDESLLTWHLATDLCYWTYTSNVEKDLYSRHFSKKVSDYMLYLLLRQRGLVSAVAGMADIRFEDTCAEANKFTQLRLVGWRTNALAKLCRALGLRTLAQELKNKQCKILNKFCVDVLHVTTAVAPIKAKGDKSKSVLFEASRLAQQLKMFGEKQWEIMAEVWVELLCYAAVRCSPRSHVAQLSHGGELVTLVWLLMAYLGLGENFRQNRGYGVSKLVIPK